jgi:hypothetical protein
MGFSPSLPRENADARAASTDNMGNRDESNRTLCAHVGRKEEKRDLSKTTEILIKKKSKLLLRIRKKKNINYFSTQRIHIFSLPNSRVRS